MMIDLLNELVDEIGDQESHALMTGPKPGPLLYDFTFPPLYLSEVFGASIESIAKSHNAHCDKENLARTCFGKKRKRRRVPGNQDLADKWQALSDCSGLPRGFAGEV